MDVFASAEGKTIHGKANYHDGTPAKNCVVKAFDPAGKEIGRTKTDDEGKFTLEASFHCDHLLLVDAGDGHGGQYTIKAAELPEDLPPRSPGNVDHVEVKQNEANHDHDTLEEVDHNEAHFKAIHAEIVRLQEQLSKYEQRRRFRDLVGGIGFILGLAGIGYGYYYRGLLHKNRQAPQ